MVTSETQVGAAVLKVDGDLTAAAAPRVRAQMREAMASGTKALVVDLSGTEIVDSAGIGLLIAAHNSLSRAGGSLEVVGLSKDLADLFRSMRLDRHFTLQTR